MTTAKLMELRPNRAIHLHNTRCAYCGDGITPENKTQDHVIGRRFVPKGKLNANWNLIVNACRPCNNRKSDLEDDIAAITLQPDLWGRFGHEDAAAIEEARRKAANSFSRRTGKKVGDSHETTTLTGKFGPGITFNFNLTSPPQIDRERAFELARMHLVAMFFMQTYAKDTKQGGWWLHGYHPVLMVRREDWGNPIMRGFMEATRDWEWRLHAVTADGFFKAWTRIHPDGKYWAWAVEWNRSHRLIGFFGEREPAQALVDTFPKPKSETIYEGPGRFIRITPETPLPESEDTLFMPPPEANADVSPVPQDGDARTAE